METPQEPGYPPPQPPQQWAPSIPPSPQTQKFQTLCVAGVIIMVCGVIVYTSSQFAIDVEGGDYDQNVVKNIGLIGKIIVQVGTILLALGLVMAGFFVMGRSISKDTHKGLFVAAALVIGLIIGVTMMLMGFFTFS